jgi:hypothetical protein
MPTPSLKPFHLFAGYAHELFCEHRIRGGAKVERTRMDFGHPVFHTKSRAASAVQIQEFKFATACCVRTARLFCDSGVQTRV